VKYLKEKSKINDCGIFDCELVSNLDCNLVSNLNQYKELLTKADGVHRWLKEIKNRESSDFISICIQMGVI